MAKDPAFLFYPQDWIMGTVMMTNSQKGLYISLLCVQHQHGGIIAERYFDDTVGDDISIRSKFKKCENGYFNERLKTETDKRQQFCEKQKANAEKRWNATAMPNSCHGNATAMPTHMPNSCLSSSSSSLITIKTQEECKKRFAPPSQQEVADYAKEIGRNIEADRFCDFYASKGWKVGSAPMKDWKAAVRNWTKDQKAKEEPPIKLSPEAEARIAEIHRQNEYFANKKKLDAMGVNRENAAKLGSLIGKIGSL